MSDDPDDAPYDNTPDDDTVAVEMAPEPRRPDSAADDPFDEYPFDEEPPTEDPFDEMDVDTDALGDDVFAALDDEDATAVPGDARGAEQAAESVVVPKRSYCEGCPHFAAPPEVACTNPGTTIHELVDTEQFRVSNCPVVADRSSVRSIGEE